MAVSTAVLKLIHGAASLNLMSGRYAADFVPPDSDVTFAMSAGSSANRLGGAAAVSWKGNNRTLSMRVRVLGDSEREISRAIEDVRAFLTRGSEDTPVYMEWKANSETPRPTWGQDGTRFYEVVTFGSITIDPLYASKVREKAARFVVSVVVKPYALGLPQVVAQATGTIYHDTPGTNDGRDRGIVVTGNSPNHILNPIFAHTTWNTGWSANANMNATVNTDADFVLWGVRSARLQAIANSADWYNTITRVATNHTLSFYVKRPDGSAITTATILAMFAGAQVTPTLTSVGDGWYRAVYTGTASAAPAAYGVRIVTQGVTVYADGFLLEDGSQANPLVHGDMYGASWSGTVHNSATSRGVGYVRVPLDGSLFNQAQGSVRTVLTFPNVPTANVIFFQEEATSYRAYYNPGGTLWTMTDNANTVSGGSAITAGSTYVVHCVWGAGRLQIYVNGSSVGFGVAFNPGSATPTYLYIGSSPTPSFHGTQTICDFALWDTTLTTAQVLADYTNIAPLASDKQRVTSIPYCWTKDGDNQVDTYSDATYDNWAVFQGIPGNVSADTTFQLTCPTDRDTAYLSQWATREFISPERVFYVEQGGNADGTSSNSDFRRSTPGANTETGINSVSVSWSSDNTLYRFLQGREFYAIARTRIAGTGKLRQQLNISPVNTIYSQQWTPAPSTWWRYALVPSLVFPRLDFVTFSFVNMAHYVNTKNTAAVTSDIDFYCLMPRPLAIFESGSTTILRGTSYMSQYGAGAYQASGVNPESIDLEPDLYNVMQFAVYGTSFGVGTDAAVAQMTYTKVTVTPRYSLT